MRTLLSLVLVSSLSLSAGCSRQAGMVVGGFVAVPGIIVMANAGDGCDREESLEGGVGCAVAASGEVALGAVLALTGAVIIGVNALRSSTPPADPPITSSRPPRAPSASPFAFE